MGNLLVMVLVLVFVLSLTPVYGDVLEPGQKTVPIYYVLENMNQYPGYVFLLHGDPSPDFMILNSSPFTFYKFSVASIYAVDKSQFNPEELMALNTTQVEGFFQNNTRLLRSNHQLRSIYGTVKDTNPLDNATIMLKVVALDEDGLEIRKDRIIFGYHDGQSLSRSFVEQNSTPASPRDDDNLYWYYLLPILAALAIILILLYRWYR